VIFRTIEEYGKDALRLNSGAPDDVNGAALAKRFADAKREVEEAKSKLAAIEEEARHKGVPAGWLDGSVDGSDAGTSGSPAAEPDAATRRAEWQRRMSEARDRIPSAEAAVAKARFRLQQVPSGLLHPDNVEARKALEEALTELEFARQALSDLEDQARRTGVPPGWLRE
jgi:DNA repair exonuclease SbcCD ATPase subunit